MHNRVEAKKQGASHNKIHYSWEVPNDGYLDPEWNSGKISRFLRAMDYGILKTLGDPKIILQGKRYTWISYEITENHTEKTSGIEKTKDSIIVYKKDRVFKLKNYSQKETD